MFILTTRTVVKGVENGEYIMDESDYEIPILYVYSDASYSHLHQWKQYRNNVKSLASLILAGMF